MKIFISPHNDDETLFGSFTIIREKCAVVVCFDSYVQVQRGAEDCGWLTRRNESTTAIIEFLLPKGPLPSYLGIDDSEGADGSAYELRSKLALFAAEARRQYKGPIEHVYLPAWDHLGHWQHNLVHDAARRVFEGIPFTKYATYTKTRKMGGELVPCEPEWIVRKLNALACYKSQIGHPQCREHFMRGLHEYYVP